MSIIVRHILLFGTAKMVAFLLLACCGIKPVSAQTGSDVELVQAVVVGVRSPQHAHEGDLLLRGLPGVLMSRMDHNTRNLMLHLQPGHDLTADAINALILPLGMQVRCFRKALLSSAPFKHLDPRTCSRPDALR